MIKWWLDFLKLQRLWAKPLTMKGFVSRAFIDHPTSIECNGYNISSDIRTFLLQFTHSKRMQYGISGHKSQFLPSLIFSVKLTIMVHRQKVELKWASTIFTIINIIIMKYIRYQVWGIAMSSWKHVLVSDT